MLIICLLVLFTCTPVRVEIHPREVHPAKIDPDKTAQGKNTAEKTLPVRPPQTKIPSEIPRAETPVEIPIEKTYEEMVIEWKSYQDLARWMEKDFSTDLDRSKRYEGRLPVPRTPRETFRLKSGIYIDVAIFLKETLNRIDPFYQAQIVVIIMRPYRYNHYVCSFKKEGEIFIMDYGTPYKEVSGVHGPFRSLEEYKKFYEERHPVKRKVEAITYLN